MRRVILLLTALLFVAACGTKGPLYLPKPTPPAPAADDSKNPKGMPQ